MTSGDPKSRLDPSVAARLRRVGGRLRGYALVEGLAWFAVFLLAAALAQFTLDYGLHGLRWSMRAALTAALLATGIWLLWRRVVWPLRVPVDPPHIAALLERRYPQLSSLLISAVRFSRGEVGPADVNSPALIERTVARARQAVDKLDFDVVLNPRRARWSGLAVLGVLAGAVTAVAAAPEMTGLWFARNVLLQDVAWPKQTRLIVDASDGELIAARGDDVVIEATASGVQPREVQFYFETVSGKRGRETMATVGSYGAYRYRHTLRNAQEDLTFYLRGGDDETDPFRLRLVDRPRVARSQMHVVPPDYTKLDPLTLSEDQRTAQVLPGTRVTFEIETSKPVVEAVLTAGHDPIAPASPEDQVPSGGTSASTAATRFSAAIVPELTRTYHFALRDELGLENRQPVRFSIKVVPDDPPRVRMKLVGAGEMITPDAVLPIEVEFSDAYGLASAELVYQLMREGMTEGQIAMPAFRPGASSFSTSLNWPAAAAAAQPGDRLSLFARAADYDDVSGPNVAQSPEITLRVVTRDELLAELARREQEYRMDFERLVDAQEQLRGQLLTVLGRVQRSDETEQLPTMVSPLERRQRNIAGSVNVVRQQFEQILGELRINQLATTAVEQRLGEGIIEPITQLARRDLVLAADTLRRWARDGSPEIASEVDPQQVALLSRMREILGNMLQWEGYQEAITMLRDILRLEAELRDETKKNLQERASDVFEN